VLCWRYSQKRQTWEKDTRESVKLLKDEYFDDGMGQVNMKSRTATYEVISEKTQVLRGQMSVTNFEHKHRYAFCFKR
jgi:hypothetical protein